MARKKLLKSNIEDPSFKELFDEICFSDFTEPPEGAISLFSIKGNTPNTSSPSSQEVNTIKTETTPSNNKETSPLSNSTIINDEDNFTTKISYMLRNSTTRKIIELKGLHPSLNTYVSSIVDTAIDHYYNHIINDGGIQMKNYPNSVKDTLTSIIKKNEWITLRFR